MKAPTHPCYDKGYRDAQLGHTANPYGVDPCATKWREGYDAAAEAGEAQFPRFGKLTERKKR